MMRFDVILRAKKLGPRSNHIRRLRKAVAIIMIIFCPLYIIGNVLAALRVHQKEVYVFLYALSGFAVLLTMGISIVLLVVITCWISKLDKEEKKSKKIRRIVRKNILITFNNCVVIFFTSPFIFSLSFIAETLPANYYCKTSPHSFLFLITPPSDSIRAARRRVVADDRNIFPRSPPPHAQVLPQTAGRQPHEHRLHDDHGRTRLVELLPRGRA